MRVQAAPSKAPVLPGCEVRGRFELAGECAMVSVSALGRDVRNATVCRLEKLACVIDAKLHEHLLWREMKDFARKPLQRVHRDRGTLSDFADQNVLSEISLKVLKIDLKTPIAVMTLVRSWQIAGNTNEANSVSTLADNGEFGTQTPVPVA